MGLMNRYSLVVFFALSVGAVSAKAAQNQCPVPPVTVNQGVAACQDLNSNDVVLNTSFYQGHTSPGNLRDMKLGLQCTGLSAERLFWALARRNYGIDLAVDLKDLAELWDNGKKKVSLFLLNTDAFDASQLACYATLEQSNGKYSIAKPYCLTTFATNDGVNQKLNKEKYFGGVQGTLFNAMRKCFKSSAMKRDGDRYYLACEGTAADELLTVFRDGKSLTGERYSLTKEELRAGPISVGTGSAVYSSNDRSEKVVFGEEAGLFGWSMKLSDNCQCEKILDGEDAGKASCRFLFGHRSNLFPAK
ncbi:MAG: hypothetical protein KGQ59_04705 [Bdellovibrionales bacterium]|nr:hypothetical protein [Bdellovibrionales bacterium]